MPSADFFLKLSAGRRAIEDPPEVIASSAHHPCLIAFPIAPTIPAPTRRLAVMLGTKYGYTINAIPAATCGYRSCFLPYVNSTKPRPLVMSDRNSSPGSRDMTIIRELNFGERADVFSLQLANSDVAQFQRSKDALDAEIPLRRSRKAGVFLG